MSILMIAGLPFGGGERLASGLAKELGWNLLTREDAISRLAEEDIHLGELEVAASKGRISGNRFDYQRRRYLAGMTALLCEMWSKGPLVYYGRAGHRLLPGVRHVARVGVFSPRNLRVERVQERLRLPSAKAVEFLSSVDRDIESWVRYVHGATLQEADGFDLVLWTGRLSFRTAVPVLGALAVGMEFQPTEESRSRMRDLALESRVHLELTCEPGGLGIPLEVIARGGRIHVTLGKAGDPLAQKVRGFLRDRYPGNPADVTFGRLKMPVAPMGGRLLRMPRGT
ncbi:MAG: cytidylate kinase family protein [Acidobacteriota bacterium]